MLTVTYKGKTYICTTALRGTDYVHLLDKGGYMLEQFTNVTDFSEFVVSGGAWTAPPAAYDYYVKTIGNRCKTKSGNEVYWNTDLFTYLQSVFDITGGLLEDMDDRKREIDVERARINALLALEDGSTTGDAELQDIRIGHDGVVYDSAGDAVREQTLDLLDSIRVLEGKKAFSEIAFDETTRYLHIYGEDGSDVVAPVYIPGGSGGGTGGGTGGGGGGLSTLSVANKTGWLTNTVSDSSDCIVTFNWSSVEDGLQTGNGSMTLKINGASKLSKTIEQGDVTINLKEYLSAGSNIVRITVTDVYGMSRTLAMEVEVVTFGLTSAFDDTIVYTGDVSFPFTPTGAATKTMQFILNDSLIGSTDIVVSGRQQRFTIPKQSHGSHGFKVYFTATVNGVVVESNPLYYDIMWEEAGNNKPIISSSFNITKMTQYYAVSIPWLAYTPNSLTSDVTLYVNGEVYRTLTAVDRTKQMWTYRADTDGDVLLEIVTGTGELETRKQFNITVAKANIEVSAEENDLDLYLTSYGRSNVEEDPASWIYGSVAAQFEGFNWVSDGWQHDEDNNTVLRVTGDARVTIPFNIFGSDFRATGKTIEFEFATRDVMNYETIVMSSLSDNKGIVVTPNQITLTSEQSTIFQRYNENEKIRVSFVIDKRVENRLVNLYINGILSGVIQYPESDDFQQGTPVGLTIGSNDCGIDIYNIRIYSNNLTRYQMLDNWIADMQNGYDLMQAYSHNNIYDDYGQIVIGKLPSNLPYLVLESASLPQYKGDKKTCAGYYVDPINPDKSFRFEGAQIDVQGTSSQYYARKNYKIKFKSGFIMEASGQTVEKYQMRDDSIPVDTFTFKADVASCEGANNVELVKLWDDICPYKTPPQVENPDVRQGIDGFPIVCFWSNGVETSFLGKYNFNNDKGTEEVFGFEEGDESWEIKNNTSARSMFKSADFEGTAWLEDFEGRFPDGNTDPTNLKTLAAWLVSTDQAQATGDALTEAVAYDGVTYTNDTAAYRLAKFKVEAEDWLEMASIIFSYVFTELFLLVDSRAKNNFPSDFVESKWCVLPYDMDTALGTNNEGLLVFDYNLEDIDTINGSNVYNGQDSVLYINIRDAFGAEIEDMYKQLRSSDLLSYDIVAKRFADHQALWPEAIFNEDAYFKYIQPLIDNGEATYLSMCQGSKKSQREWWLYNRFRYLDSKYTCGDALTSTITLRAYQKSDFEIIPYADIYPCVAFDSTRVKARGRRNEVCDIVSPEHWDPNGSDAVVTVYSADQLKDIGDISPFKVGYADFSKATKLQRIKVGDASASYNNPNMTELYVGNNTLLKVVDARNCSNLAANVDLSGCSNIEEVYFDGTSVIGVTLPNGGVLKKLHLPATVTNLTLMNQNGLTELVIPTYANITTLRLENVGGIIDTFEILRAIPANSRVRMIGVEWSFEDASEIVSLSEITATMRGLDENGNNVDTPQISGTCHLEYVHIKDLNALTSAYPFLTFTYDELDTKSITREYIKRTMTGMYRNDRVTKLRDRAFLNMPELTGVDFALVASIGENAFQNSAKLSTIILRYGTLVTIENTNALANTPIAKGTGYIYVPKALIDSYKTATNWATYANQFRAIEDYPEICGGDR